MPKKQREHPSEDSTWRFEVDALIRSYGYRIHSRPKKGSVLWSINGEHYPQEKVLQLLDKEDVVEAQRRELTYYRYIYG